MIFLVLWNLKHLFSFLLSFWCKHRLFEERQASCLVQRSKFCSYLISTSIVNTGQTLSARTMHSKCCLLWAQSIWWQRMTGLICCLLPVVPMLVCGGRIFRGARVKVFPTCVSIKALITLLRITFRGWWLGWLPSTLSLGVWSVVVSWDAHSQEGIPPVLLRFKLSCCRRFFLHQMEKVHFIVWFLKLTISFLSS